MSSTEAQSRLRSQLWKAGWRTHARAWARAMGEEGTVRLPWAFTAGGWTVEVRDGGTGLWAGYVYAGGIAVICTEDHFNIRKPRIEDTRPRVPKGKDVRTKRNIRFSDNEMARIIEACGLADKGWTTYVRDTMMQHCDTVLGVELGERQS